MSRINSRAKGKRGELEWAKFLHEMGFEGAERSGQFCGNSGDADVRSGIEGTHCEVKRVESLNVYQAMEQAEQDCPDDCFPYIAWRRNRKPWLFIVKAEYLEDIAREIALQKGWL